MTHLEALREAVKAKIAYWDATLALETALGYPDGEISNKNSDAIVDTIDVLASAVDSESDVDEGHVTDLLGMLT